MAKAEIRPEIPVEREVILTLSETEAKKLHAVLFSGVQAGEPDLRQIQITLERVIGTWRVANLKQHARWGSTASADLVVQEGYSF